MIFTCTTNPSLDYYVSTGKSLQIGENNLSDFERFDSGGKGVNVSCVLSNLSIPSICLGFLGGFVQEFYLKDLKKYKYLQPLFTTIQGITRINLKIINEKEVTDINASGPNITNEEFDKFKKRLQSIYPNDYFVLSGNIQEEIEDKIVETVQQLANNGVKIILDCNLRVIKKCANLKPFLIRLHEDVNDTKSIDDAAKELIKLGCKSVLYSYFRKPFCLYCENNKYIFDDVDPNRQYITGTSETLIAGFLYGMLRGANPYESFKYACATIKTTSISSESIDNSVLENKYNEINLKEQTL